MIDPASAASAAAIWLAIAVCGWLAWPVARRLFPDATDQGYLAAKPLGWLFGSYAAWLAGIGGVPFWRFGWMVGLAALGLLCLAFLKRGTPLPPVRRLIASETGFIGLFILGVLVKAAAPDIHGLEKYMDFGFVNAALRAQAMPPSDMWWAGEPINYYYVGHVAAAWLIQLAHVPADHGFNLMLAVMFAFTGCLTYRIVEGPLRIVSSGIAVTCGVAAAALVTLGGNFHSVLYGPLRWLSPTTLPRDFYFSDSTRFIGFDPQGGDKGFTEMPGYGFAVGDLHAHVLNLPAAFLIALILTRIASAAAAGRGGRFVTLPEGAALAFLFALSAMTNSWDAVSYGLMMGWAGVVILLQPGGPRPGRLARLAAAAALVVVAAVVLASPFLLTFRQIASGLLWTDGGTPLWQLAIVYGHVALPCAALIALAFTPLRRDPRWAAGFILAATAVTLVVLPEIGYVRDIYGADHRRANTVFKLSFEAQPLGIMAGCILVGLLFQSRRWTAKAAGVLVALPLVAPISYVVYTRGDFLASLGSKPLTLDGLAFVSRDRPDDRPLLDWLREQPADRPILLAEAAGESFGETGRLSALSGVPALLGWKGHEWLWRGDYVPVWGRADRIAAFYRAKTFAEVCDFVRASHVTHVAVGTVERESYQGLDDSIFKQLGNEVARGGSSFIVEVGPACRG